MRDEPEQGDGFQLEMSLKAAREALREPWESDLGLLMQPRRWPLQRRATPVVRTAPLSRA